MLQTAAEYDCSGLIYQCLYAAGINPASNIVDHALAIYEYTSANLLPITDSALKLHLTICNRAILYFMPKMVKAAYATLLFMPETDASMILGRASVFPTAH